MGTEQENKGLENLQEETFSHLVIAYRLNYIPDPLYQALAGEVKRLRQMLNGYISFLKSSKIGENEIPGGKSYIREEPYEYEITLENPNELPNNESTNNDL